MTHEEAERIELREKTEAELAVMRDEAATKAEAATSLWGQIQFWDRLDAIEEEQHNRRVHRPVDRRAA